MVPSTSRLLVGNRFSTGNDSIVMLAPLTIARRVVPLCTVTFTRLGDGPSYRRAAVARTRTSSMVPAYGDVTAPPDAMPPTETPAGATAAMRPKGQETVAFTLPFTATWTFCPSYQPATWAQTPPLSRLPVLWAAQGVAGLPAVVTRNSTSWFTWRSSHAPGWLTMVRVTLSGKAGLTQDSTHTWGLSGMRFGTGTINTPPEKLTARPVWPVEPTAMPDPGEVASLPRPELSENTVPVGSSSSNASSISPPARA